MNNDYARAVKDIASKYSGIVSSSGVFTGEEAARLTRGITDEVMPLLNFEKPKVLVYGIYNSGKSTLVNAICGHEAAEVANRPMTWKVAEYDAGKYVLIDSPGIDAPQEHEIIADKEINACHVILFVITTEGGFEQSKNYAKMLDLIQRGLPFIIVINDYDVSDDEQDTHLREINDIKRKVIENLKRECSRKGISGNDIQDKYDIIVVNALYAWEGVSNDEKAILAESRISDLTNSIDKYLEGKGAMKTLLAPLSALERKIVEGEKILTAKTAGEDYAQKRETLQMKVSQFMQSFTENVRYAAERHTEELYQGYLGGQIDMKSIYNEICADAESSYRRSSEPIISYIRTNFSALNISVDNNGGVTLNTPAESQQSALVPSDNHDKETIYLDMPSEDEESHSFSNTAALLGAALGSVIPGVGTLLGAGGGALVGKVAGEILDYFFGKQKREEEKYERMRREIEAYNRREQQRAEEEQRRKQSARIAATNQISAIIRDLRTLYSDVIERKFNAALKLIDEAIARTARGNEAIRRTSSELEELRREIQALRRQITC